MHGVKDVKAEKVTLIDWGVSCRRGTDELHFWDKVLNSLASAQSICLVLSIRLWCLSHGCRKLPSPWVFRRKYDPIISPDTVFHPSRPRGCAASLMLAFDKSYAGTSTEDEPILLNQDKILEKTVRSYEPCWPTGASRQCGRRLIVSDCSSHAFRIRKSSLLFGSVTRTSDSLGLVLVLVQATQLIKIQIPLYTHFIPHFQKMFTRSSKNNRHCQKHVVRRG